MNKSIEITSKSLIYLLLSLGCMVGVLLMLHKYDGKIKRNKLEKILNKISTMIPNPEEKSLLLNVKIDSLSKSDAKSIESFIINLSNQYDDYRAAYLNNIIIRENGKNYTFSFDAFRESPNTNQTVLEPISLQKKEEAMIKALEEPQANMEEVLKKRFSFLDFPYIIYPICKNGKRTIYANIRCFHYD